MAKDEINEPQELVSIPVSVRIGAEYHDLLDQIMAERVWPRRTAIEQAIKFYFDEHYTMESDP